MEPLAKTLVDEVVATCPRLFLGFSTGVDSIAAWLRALETERFDPAQAVLYYFYYIPGMTWVDEYLAYFRDKYKVPIYELASPLLMTHLGNWWYQPPARAEAIRKMQGTDDAFVEYEREQLIDYVRQWAGLPHSAYSAAGVKQGDSPRRRKAMRKQQGINRAARRWYPIWDFENRDAEAIVRRHGVKVPYDYELFGITFEQMDYRFTKVLQEQCPNNWAHMLEFFPDLAINVSRHEFYHPEWAAKKGIKFGRFRDIALKPEAPL